MIYLNPLQRPPAGESQGVGAVGGAGGEDAHLLPGMPGRLDLGMPVSGVLVEEEEDPEAGESFQSLQGHVEMVSREKFQPSQIVFGQYALAWYVIGIFGVAVEDADRGEGGGGEGIGGSHFRQRVTRWVWGISSGEMRRRYPPPPAPVSFQPRA